MHCLSLRSHCLLGVQSQFPPGEQGEALKRRALSLEMDELFRCAMSELALLSLLMLFIILT